MAEFPPNLDDGELWLPSDMFLNEVPSRFTPDRFSCMDDLTQRFASFTFFQPQRNVSKPPLHVSPNLERFSPAVQYPQGYPSVNGGLEDAHGLYGYETGSYFHGQNLLDEYQLLESLQPQVVDSLRARVRRSQQNHRLPFRGNGGVGGGGGGFVRESAGTGVFHPRVMNTTTTPTATDIRKKHGLRNRPEIQVAQQGNCINGIGMGKQGESHYQRTPEVGLPQDWSY